MNEAAKFLKILPDDNDNPFGAVQWKDANGDGDAGDTGDSKFPIGYSRSGIGDAGDVFATAMPKMKVTNPGDGGVYKIQGMLTGFSPWGVPLFTPYFPETAANLSGTTLTPAQPLEAETKIPTTIDHTAFTITWQVRVGNGAWQNVGTTVNPLYVAGQDLQGIGVRHTVLHIGSSKGAGLNPITQRTQLVDRIWAEFDDRDVRTVAGGRLTYWDGGDNTPTGIGSASLLKNLDGKCGDWSMFLMEVLGAQGVQSSQIPHPAGTMGGPAARSKLGGKLAIRGKRTRD